MEITPEKINSWLQPILSKHNIKKFEVKIVGQSEKGDGFVGNIIFLQVKTNNEEQNYVLKCSKPSELLRAQTPIREAFINEILIYEKILPIFIHFQCERNIENFFTSVPKCLGSLVTDNQEVLLFENLKARGFSLWDKTRPMTAKHLEMVLREYAKFHATSLALREQKPDIFVELIKGLQPTLKKFIEISDIEMIFGGAIIEFGELLQCELPKKVLSKWNKFKEQITFIFNDMLDNCDGLKVITHGDCWNNNYMFRHMDNEPLQLAIIDWQLSSYSSPILDLSYFIFASISGVDVENLNNFLRHYYNSFSFYLGKLGSNSFSLYPFKQFIADWRKYSRFGVLMATNVIKMCLTNKEQLPDLERMAESGGDMSQCFVLEVKDKGALKNRMRNIIKYVADNDII